MEMGYHAAQVARYCDGDRHPKALSPESLAPSPKPPTP